MGMALKISGKLNDICHAQLSAITGVTAYKGKLRMQDNTDFEEQVRGQAKETQCYAVTWVTQEIRRPIESTTGTVELSILLFFRLDQFTTTDCNSMYDLVDTIGESLTPDAVWGSLGCKMNRIQINRVENGLQDNIAEWKMTVTLDVPFC
jgi:hypothetical protein